MKKFLSKLFLFCLPLLLFSFATDILLSHCLKKSNTEAQGEFSVWNDIYSGKINSDIVIYGSSRAWIQIDPAIISNAFNAPVYNLGIDGQNIILEYFRHSMFLKYNRPPKVIIFSVDHNTLGKLKDLYNSDQFLPYMLFNNTIRQATESFNGFNLADYCIPSFRFMGRDKIIDHAARSIFKPEPEIKYRINGYKGMDLQWNNDFEKAKVKMGSYWVIFDSSSVHLFDGYLRECKEKNIKNILVYTPEYIEGQKFTKNMNEMMDIFRGFALKYNIPFYDYSKDSISFQKKYFYNSEHMNSAGSKLFTEELVKDLKRDGYVGSALQK